MEDWSCSINVFTFETASMLMTSRPPASWKRESCYPHTLSPNSFLPPSFSISPMFCNTPSCTPTFCKDYQHMFERAIPHHVWLQGLSRRYTAGLQGPANLGTPPPAFTLPLHHGIILWISVFFLFTSSPQSFLILLSKHIHLKPPPSSSSPQYPLNSRGFCFWLGSHRQVNQASWFADNESREELSSELVKGQHMHLFQPLFDLMKLWIRGWTQGWDSEVISGITTKILC